MGTLILNIRDTADHQHDHQEHAEHKDIIAICNLRAAYMHVLADTLTSLLAIVALLFSKFCWNAGWMPTAMGMVSAGYFEMDHELNEADESILLNQNIDDEYRNGITEILALCG